MHSGDAVILDATAVAFTEIDGVAILMMAEREDGGDVLEIQLADSFDDQDRRVGMDRHCLVLNGGAIYGAIDAWQASETRVTLHLSSDASQQLGAPLIGVTFDTRHATTVELALRTLLPDEAAARPT